MRIEKICKQKRTSSFGRAILSVLVFCALLTASPVAWAETIYMVPGGQSIGVLLQTAGVTVTGFSPVIEANGQPAEPAAAAGLQNGDFIITINDLLISGNADVQMAVENAGQTGTACHVVYLRQGRQYEVDVEPIYCADSQRWRIGLYVRDNSAGVGTLSFYDPDSGFYAALGHQVTGVSYPLQQDIIGSVLRAQVQGLIASTAGTPGEKLGVFLNEGWQGTIRNNGTFGVSGLMNETPQAVYTNVALPVAEIDQVQPGPALIYTVLDGETVEAFEVSILKVAPNQKDNGWGMIVQVEDERLLDSCGGIIQGMSGSPIVQNNRLIGAVTHVFVNDPSHGYACFAQWMLEAAGWQAEE